MSEPNTYDSLTGAVMHQLEAVTDIHLPPHDQRTHERDEWLRTETWRGVSRADVYARPDLHDLPPFACKHEHRRSLSVNGIAMCGKCKTGRAEWLAKIERDAEAEAKAWNAGFIKILRGLGWPGA